jgi:hypothetical protein
MLASGALPQDIKELKSAELKLTEVDLDQTHKAGSDADAFRKLVIAIDLKDCKSFEEFLKANPKALHHVCSKTHDNILHMIAAHVPLPKGLDFINYLIANHKYTFLLLLKHQNKVGCFPIHYAAQFNHGDMVKVFTEHQGDAWTNHDMVTRLACGGDSAMTLSTNRVFSKERENTTINEHGEFAHSSTSALVFYAMQNPCGSTNDLLDKTKTTQKYPDVTPHTEQERFLNASVDTINYWRQKKVLSSSHPSINWFDEKKSENILNGVMWVQSTVSANKYLLALEYPGDQNRDLRDQKLMEILLQSFDKLHAVNCYELAYLAKHYLNLHFGIPAEVVITPDGDHAFLVIGRYQGSDIKKYSKEWGESAVVCDVWAGDAYPASEIYTRMKYYACLNSRIPGLKQTGAMVGKLRKDFNTFKLGNFYEDQNNLEKFYKNISDILSDRMDGFIKNIGIDRFHRVIKSLEDLQIASNYFKPEIWFAFMKALGETFLQNIMPDDLSDEEENYLKLDIFKNILKKCPPENYVAAIQLFGNKMLTLMKKNMKHMDKFFKEIDMPVDQQISVKQMLSMHTVEPSKQEQNIRCVIC